MYLHNPSGGLASHSMGVCVGGGGGGGGGWSSDTPWCLMLLQSRYSLTVQAFWLVLRTSPIHGALPSSPGRGRGWSCYIHSLLLHTSPMKVSSYFFQALWLVLTTSLVHGGGLPSNPERRGGGGGGVGVVIITPWCFMLQHCFAGPLACFRSIVHLLEC